MVSDSDESDSDNEADDVSIKPIERPIVRPKNSSTIHPIAPERANDDSVDNDGINPPVCCLRQVDHGQQPQANDGVNPQVCRLRRVAHGNPPAKYMTDPRFGNVLSIEDHTAHFTVLHGMRQTPVLVSMARIKQSDR